VLIETKLYAPTFRSGWVERRELVARLADTGTRLILLDAPAGFGKSTLVAQWRSRAKDRPFAWVSLDRGDNDPGRLWWHLVSAVQRACPEFGGQEILQELRAPVPDFTATVLPMLARALAALTRPAVLVLDDCHFITERNCHHQLAALQAALPPSTQLVIITRADPPLPAARLRAAGEITEIRAADLRFTPAEIASLVHMVAGVDLTEPDVADLADRTEGWPAGVYLAALSLRGHSSPSAFIGQFTGEHRFVADFLVDEVLTGQPDEVRQFLTRTSVLARFCAPLCDAVTATPGSAGIIDVIERQNLFVVPLDRDRRWFRYHHLFAQALRTQLALTEPDLVPALHRRASAWHRSQGSAEEAIRHAQAAGDADDAIGLIATQWRGYVDSGRAATVRGWLRRLGDDAIAAAPLAAHCASWVAALTGDQRSVRRWLPVVEAGGNEGPLPDGMPSFEFSAALLQATFGFDGIRPMREAGARAVALETDPGSPWYALARSVFGFALYLSGESELAAAQLDEARPDDAVMAMVRMVGLAVQACVAADAARIAQAEKLARMARDIVSESGLNLSKVPQSSLAYIASGAVYAARGQLPEARRELEDALRARRRLAGLSPWPTVELLLRLTPVLADQGDQAGAAGLLNEARHLINSVPDGADAQLARLGRLEQRLGGPPQAGPPARPVSEGELAVLRLLPGELSVREIAGELYLSPNTIKTHTQAIYRKLGVSSREGAVARGRELGLIEPAAGGGSSVGPCAGTPGTNGRSGGSAGVPRSRSRTGGRTPP
jgi:LuxR family transcriptional regulator, maltose regulon positive regulatory protein